jgi:putative hydrolase of the HAD superfamily
MSVRIVCFDWGGVILRHCRSWSEGCAAAGLTVRLDLDCPAGLARRRDLTMQHQRGEIDHSTYLARLAEAVGGVYTVEELSHLHESWLLAEYEGVADVITRLVATPGVETALLSNTNEAHWATHLPGREGRSPKYPTAGLLKHRHASHLMGLAKPDERIYTEFEHLVAARGPEILFFDDLADNIAAASRLHWRCVHVDHTGDTASQISRALVAHGVWR